MAESRGSFVRLEDQHSLLEKKTITRQETKFDIKLVAFFTVGVLSFLYVVAELGAAIRLDSLVLLSDGFHNLSDVISLGIAYWARQATKRESSDAMSYGWARTEILGGLTNGCFLLSLVVYVMLQSIPKLIDPQPMEGGLLFIIIAGSGLAINTIGTVVFLLTGQAHAHSHAHGGHSHGHGHGDEEKKAKKKEKKKELKPELVRTTSIDLVELEDGGHAVGSHDEKSEKKKKESNGEKKEKHGHSHGHGHEHKDKEKKEKKKDGGHSHGHGHEHKEKEKPKRDENLYAVFLHFLGDAVSSLMVLGAGFLIHYFKTGRWTDYIDPVSSLIISALILWTTVPLVKRCSMILLQSTGDVPVKAIRKKLAKVEGLLSVHDLHIWQLVDGMTIASLHVAIEEGTDFNTIVADIKKIFHKNGVHSTSIQPEFVPRNFASGAFCVQNCVQECDEEWCCKKSYDNLKQLEDQYSIQTEL